jgi:hypothetical protein
VQINHSDTFRSIIFYDYETDRQFSEDCLYLARFSFTNVHDFLPLLRAIAPVSNLVSRRHFTWSDSVLSLLFVVRNYANDGLEYPLFKGKDTGLGTDQVMSAQPGQPFLTALRIVINEAM